MMRSLLALLLLMPVLVQAATHTIAASATAQTWNCETNGVNPGDVIEIVGGTSPRAELRISDCIGTTDDWITIRNRASDNGPVTFQRPAGAGEGYRFGLHNARFVHVDGTGGWDGMPAGATCGYDPATGVTGTTGCGFRAVAHPSLADNVTNYVVIKGRDAGSNSTAYPIADEDRAGNMRDIIIEGFEIDGTDGKGESGSQLGLHFNDHELCASNFSDVHELTGRWRENVIVRNNYIHDVDGEGMYFGPNWISGINATKCPDAGDTGVAGDNNGVAGDDNMRLRNIEISNNFINRTGVEGINLKSCFGSSCLIKGNRILVTGYESAKVGDGSGIGCFEGSCLAVGNRVEQAGEAGITTNCNNYDTDAFGFLSHETYNNVIIEAGAGSDPNGPGDGITGAGPEYTTVVHRNNTVVGSEAKGIEVFGGSTGVVVRNNISVDNGNDDIDSFGEATITGNLPATTDTSTAVAADAGFVNAVALDFRLAEGSAAIDVSGLANYPVDDFLGVSRPQGDDADQGAYEYETASAPPDPPAPPSSTRYAPRGFIQ